MPGIEPATVEQTRACTNEFPIVEIRRIKNIDLREEEVKERHSTKPRGCVGGRVHARLLPSPNSPPISHQTTPSLADLEQRHGLSCKDILDTLSLIFVEACGAILPFGLLPKHDNDVGNLTVARV